MEKEEEEDVGGQRRREKNCGSPSSLSKGIRKRKKEPERARKRLLPPFAHLRD